MFFQKGSKFIAVFLSLVAAAGSAFAVGGESYVEFSAKPDSVRLATSAGVAAPILVDSRDFPGVIRAAGDLRDDIGRVTGFSPKLVSDENSPSPDVVIVGTLGKNRLLDELARSGRINAENIKDRWESFLVQTVENPLPGVRRALVIAGGDKRGTIFGIYDLSEKIGVSPWYWWADVPVKKHAQLFAAAKTLIRDAPKVKYRGIFLNDEAPALTGWAREKFGGYNHKFYTKVFELLLRLKANYLWTAMWGNAFYDDDPENARFADEYGIVIGTSHHEPLQRAHDEWRRYGKGAWDYTKNAETLRAFWTEGVRRARGFESIITLGMRGDGDEPMSREANTELLERVVADQRRIIAENVNPKLEEVPQIWALYKEVQEYYERGMRVPDDVTLLWSDDNWGNIRRLPTADEQRRAGGAGVYYHFDYVGGPRSYKWLNTVPITKVWEQMNLAYARQARRIWIVNVGDLKPMEFPIEFFLNQAWDPEKFTAADLDDFTRAWATREFGAVHAEEIADIIGKYTKYNYRRKPELLEPDTYSLTNYAEAETVLADYRKIAERAERIYKLLPKDAKDAFFQLVLYPAKACANLNELYVTVGKNRLYAVQGRASTNELANRARALFGRDAELARYYNETMAGGKWNHMMDQTRIGYTFWNQPVRNAMPGVQEVQVPLKAEMGVTVEGFDFRRGMVLPEQNVYDRKGRYFEIFNLGRTPFKFTAKANEPWLKLSQTSGTITKDQRILVSADWSAVPTGATRGEITVTGPDDRRITIAVPVFKPEFPKPEEVRGFVETNGYVSIEAEHFTRSVAPPGSEWKIIPDFGRTLSGVTLFPVTAPPQDLSADGPQLEYRMYLFREGEVKIDLYFAPTQAFQPGGGLRFAVSLDDDEPQLVNFHEGYTQTEWERSVRDGVRVIASKHTISKPGDHILKFRALDAGLVLQKLVVNTGGLRPSYLGPPESFWRKK
jgi:hypothetical protein